MDFLIIRLIAGATALGALAACGGQSPTEEQAAPTDCAEAAELAPCGEDAICLDGACTPLQPCTDCTDPVSFTLPDTLLDTCQGADGPVPCPDDGGSATCADTPLCGQDAQYGWDLAHDRSERFTVAGADSEPVVADTVTGLVWHGCVMGQDEACAGQATRGPWAEAKAFCADLDWGGHGDWELPTAPALQSIVDYSTTSPALDPDAFPNAPSLFDQDGDEWWIECTWTASTTADDADVVWAVMANSGDVLSGSGVDYHLHDKAAAGWEGCYTRCVRPSAPQTHDRFLAAGTAEQPIVADVVTKRSWQGCSVGQQGEDCAGEATMVPWADALATCEGSEWAGHTDWRLPNVTELRSVVDLRFTRPAIDPAWFPNTPYYVGADDREGQYWSSTARWYNGFALYVSFHDGGNHFYVQDEARHVRCVRGG
jgi:hypothetical protein